MGDPKDGRQTLKSKIYPEDLPSPSFVTECALQIMQVNTICFILSIIYFACPLPEDKFV